MSDRPLHTITSPLYMQNFAASPVNKTNKVQWTAQERERPLNAVPITTLSDIQPKMNGLFVMGKPYHGIKFINKNKEFLGLLTSQNPIIKKRLEALQDYLKVEMLNHMNRVESSDKPFTTIHFDHYIRFAEKGHGAPTFTHSDLIKKAGVARVNHTQRLPYPSNTIHLNPDQYSSITNILQDFCSIVAQAIEKYLPDTYSHLNLACSIMPLDENIFSALFLATSLEESLLKSPTSTFPILAVGAP
ncbi:hypothetical protein BDR03DRAFT_1008971 [Suillus americanus]|nr:hypothetical protein BDR03DRAFT_1008971 [Suillus americanus]